MLQMKLLGPGCAGCWRLEQIAARVVDRLGIEASVDERLVCAGRVPDQAEVTTWVTSALLPGDQ